MKGYRVPTCDAVSALIGGDCSRRFRWAGIAAPATRPVLPSHWQNPRRERSTRNLILGPRAPLLWEGECEHRALPRADDVLLAVHGVTDWTARVRAAKIDVPEQFTRLCIQRNERPVHPSAEHEIA